MDTNRKEENTELFSTQTIDIFTGKTIFKNKSRKLRIIRGDKMLIHYFKYLDIIRKKMKDDSSYKEYCGVYYLFNVD